MIETRHCLNEAIVQEFVLDILYYQFGLEFNDFHHIEDSQFYTVVKGGQEELNKFKEHLMTSLSVVTLRNLDIQVNNEITFGGVVRETINIFRRPQ